MRRAERIEAALRAIVENADEVEHDYFGLQGCEGFDPATVLKEAESALSCPAPQVEDLVKALEEIASDKVGGGYEKAYLAVLMTARAALAAYQQKDGKK